MWQSQIKVQKLSQSSYLSINDRERIVLPEDVQSLVDLCLEHPENNGALKAVLVLMEKASDSKIILEALGMLSPFHHVDDETLKQITLLLERAGATDISERWLPSAKKIKQPVTKLSVIDGSTDQAVEDIQFRAPKPAINLEDIAGLHDVKVQIKRKIIRPFEAPGLFKKFKRRSGGGVLMYGPPGCGKTMLARAVASECKANFIEVRASEVIDKYVGVAEKKITALFDRARDSLPAVLFFDEVEALAHKRQYGSSGNLSTVISTLLTEMDGVSANEGMLFLGATNVPWALDSAFRRPGRFDRMIFVPPPDKVARGFLLNQILSQRPIVDGLDIETIVERSSGYSGADLEGLVETAVDYAIEESSPDNIVPINNLHFKQAFRDAKATTGEWLRQAKNFAEYGNQDGLYDDLLAFLKKYSR